MATPHDTWNFPDQGLEPGPPALEGWILTTGPPGKSPDSAVF